MIDNDEVVLGFGKSVAFSDTENGSYTTVDGTQEINLPERDLGEAEFTNDQSANFHKEFKPGLYDPGTTSVTYTYTATTFGQVEELFQLAADAGTRDEAVKWWKITIPDGSTAKFQGFVKSHGLPQDLEGINVVEFEIRATGPMEYTAAAGS